MALFDGLYAIWFLSSDLFLNLVVSNFLILSFAIRDKLFSLLSSSRAFDVLIIGELFSISRSINSLEVYVRDELAVGDMIHRALSVLALFLFPKFIRD